MNIRERAFHILPRLACLSVVLCIGSVSSGLAQTPRPAVVGAMIRSDSAAAKDVDAYLETLESSLADKLSGMKNISFQDHTATSELMHEVHVTLGSEADLTNGGLSELASRLDFLVVIDQVDPSTAKMRLFDVRSGAIRHTGTCPRKGPANLSCVVAMAHGIEIAGTEALPHGAKGQ